MVLHADYKYMLYAANWSKEGLGPVQFLMVVSVTCEGSQCYHISQRAESMPQYYAGNRRCSLLVCRIFEQHNILLWGLWTQVQRLVHQPHFATAIRASAA